MTNYNAMLIVVCWLIETRVVFELVSKKNLDRLEGWLIETRVVFECLNFIILLVILQKINRNKSCIWIVRAYIKNIYYSLD